MKNKHRIYWLFLLTISWLRLPVSCTQLDVEQVGASLKISAGSGLIVGKKRWASCTVGWNTVGTFTPEQTQMIEAAMSEINKIKVYFTLTKNNTPHIKVAFASPEQVGKNNTEGVLTYRKPALASIEGNVSRGYTIYLNQAHTWTTTQLKAVVMNQLGEIMGLPISTNEKSIMYPWLNPTTPTVQWSQEDVQELKQLYPESGLPAVKAGLPTLAPANKTHTIEINITNFDNIPPISNLGVCWSSTNPTPTIDNTEGRNAYGSESKSLLISLWELKSGTRYYLRGYASNACGIQYSEVVVFSKQ